MEATICDVTEQPVFFREEANTLMQCVIVFYREIKTVFFSWDTFIGDTSERYLDTETSK